MKAKRCSKCHKTKTIKEFHRRKTSKNGLTSQCKKCRKEYGRQWHKNNRTKGIENNRRWYKANRFRAALRYSRKHAEKHGYFPCSATLKEIKAAYTGYCAICGISEENCKRRLCLDHNHGISGVFRGWLCDKCNLMIGHADDSIQRLQLAIAYLGKYQ